MSSKHLQRFKHLKYTKILTMGALTTAVLFGWATVVHAQSFRSGDNMTVAAGETVNSTLFVVGKSIDIAGTVNGDVFCGGQNVTVTGHVTGDVICGGQSVRISGTVDGDVRVAGQNVTIGGTVKHNLTAFGQTITTESDSSVEGDVSAAGQDTVLNGSISRDLAIASGTVTVNGKVGRNVQGNAEHLSLGKDAQIAGSVTYTSTNDLKKDGNAQVAGKITHHAVKPKTDNNRGGRIALFVIWLFVSMLLLALALVLLMPQTFQRAASATLQHPGMVFLTGLVASIVAPIAIVILFATVIGIPLAILALLAWLVLLIASGPFSAYLVGRLIWQDKGDNAIWIMLTGAAVLVVVYFIPILGFIIMLLAMWFGLGTILWQVGHMQRQNYKV
jgi:hypothetical protein